MILDSISALSEEIGTHEKTVATLLANKIIPSISYGTKKKTYFTNTELIEYASTKISEYFGKSFESKKELFSLKELKDEDFYQKLYFSNNKNQDATVIGIANQKGGVGKTTTSTNIAASLAFLNKKVLLVDTDSQSQASRAFHNERRDGKTIKNLLEIFKEDRRKLTSDVVNDIIYTQDLDGFSIDVLPSELRLAKVMELIRMEPMNHTALDTILTCVKSNYDYIVIDTPPNPGMALEMSIYASDNILISTNCQDFGQEGVMETVKEIKYFSQVVKKELAIAGITINDFGNTVSEIEIFEDYMEIITGLGLDIDDNLLKINRASVVPNSQKDRIALLNYATDKKSAKNIMKITEEYFKFINYLENKGV